MRIAKGLVKYRWKSGIYIRQTYENNLHDLSNLMIIAKIMQDCIKNLSSLPFRSPLYLNSINGGETGAIISYLSYDGSFSASFSVCVWRFYVFFFSYRRAC